MLQENIRATKAGGTCSIRRPLHCCSLHRYQAALMYVVLCARLGAARPFGAGPRLAQTELSSVLRAPVNIIPFVFRRVATPLSDPSPKSNSASLGRPWLAYVVTHGHRSCFSTWSSARHELPPGLIAPPTHDLRGASSVNRAKKNSLGAGLHSSLA